MPDTYKLPLINSILLVVVEAELFKVPDTLVRLFPE
uniref:Uncharacterized protein n=1 Tax=Siphoviridae sp. ctOkv13 TaxID=2826314 RepID=A0A8S5M2T3_9CAUD|nr:MAG TPA: hypothetical protein [Siphoviridae sp. ctOkv13]